MNRPIRYVLSLTACFTFLSLMCGNVAGQTLGPPFRVNTYTLYSQSRPAVTIDGLGNAAIVWGSNLQDGDGYGVYGQRYDNSLSPLGSEFQVNTTTAGHQWYPDVASNSGGHFVVVWETWPDIYAACSVFQRYDDAGMPLGTETPVANSWADDFDMDSKVVLCDAGGFETFFHYPTLVTETTYIFARGYDDDGILCRERTLWGGSLWAYRGYDVAGNWAGDFVVVWASSSDYFITGTVCDELDSETEISISGNVAAVAMNSNGEFVVVSRPFNADTTDIVAQRFDADGTPIGDELEVRMGILASVPNVAVAMLDNGDFLVVWEQDPASVPWDVYARRFCCDNGTFMNEFQVNTPGLHSRLPDVAAAPDGSFLIVWGEDSDVYARSLSPLATAVTNRDGGTPEYSITRTYPNPFGKTTTIEYSLAQPADVTIRIYSAAGALVATIPEGRRSPGLHTAMWDGVDSRGNRVSSGTYFLEMRSGDVLLTKKVVVLR